MQRRRAGRRRHQPRPASRWSRRGAFREDLYYRLNVVHDRAAAAARAAGATCSLLAEHFLARFARANWQARRRHLPRSSARRCSRYPWPGNVRELQNCIERAVMLAEGDTVHAQHLNVGVGEGGRGPQLAAPRDPWDDIDLSGTLPEASRRVLTEVERRKIQQALDEARWDRVRAAAVLQIPPRLLLARIRDFKLAPHGRR